MDKGTREQKQIRATERGRMVERQEEKGRRGGRGAIIIYQVNWGVSPLDHCPIEYNRQHHRTDNARKEKRRGTVTIWPLASCP